MSSKFSDTLGQGDGDVQSGGRRLDHMRIICVHTPEPTFYECTSVARSALDLT
jgi:hypothetical protein